MRAAHRKRRDRRSFTLVELLTVVTILGILVSLITAAAYRATVKAKQTKITLELKQLEMAAQAHRDRCGALPPDFTNSAVATRHLKRAFPLAASFPDITGQSPVTALTFWLGGVYDTQERRFIGFSPNPRDPFDIEYLTANSGATLNTEGRIGPFFEFDAERVAVPASAYDLPNARYKLGARYYPPSPDNPTSPYVYFRAENGDYTDNYWDRDASGTLNNADVAPLRDGRVAATPRPWINPDSFQIICGGLDGIIGTGTNFPDGSAEDPYTAYDDDRWDDQANFLQGTFEDARD